MEPENSALQQYVMSAAPPEWSDYADELRACAELLWGQAGEGRAVASGADGSITDKSSVSRTCTLLAALALENLLKGILVAHDPLLVSSGSLHHTLKSHRLADLAGRLSGISLTPEELRQIAQQAIPYWGRYPVPLRQDQLAREAVLDEVAFGTFRSLYSRLHEDLYRQIRDGWDSGVGLRLVRHSNSQYEPQQDPSGADTSART